ncbi:sigma-70 family RNA polymerase sigma factor, partial [Sphingomonas bacterium]|uniref:sigma-70 family RNA polymerase sigma factor n=1 Tax=Sphingomonas bacterium TaxID=1895847 RepID=UPI00157752E1
VQTEADELPDAERALLARERLRKVEAAMADMPERMRIALVMFRFEDKPQRAIAERLEISVSGVEKLLQRAYRIILAASEDGSEDDADRHRLSDEGGSPGAN